MSYLCFHFSFTTQVKSTKKKRKEKKNLNLMSAAIFSQGYNIYKWIGESVMRFFSCMFLNVLYRESIWVIQFYFSITSLVLLSVVQPAKETVQPLKLNESCLERQSKVFQIIFSQIHVKMIDIFLPHGHITCTSTVLCS